jgi:hypothetical protein
MDNPRPPGLADFVEPLPVDEIIPDLMEVVRTGDAEMVSSDFYFYAWRQNMGRTDVLARMLDPASGDSALHVAAENGNLDALRAISKFFVTVCYSWNMHVRKRQILTMKNKAGDTALHCAARNGDLDVVRGVYRLFCNDWLPGQQRLSKNPPAEYATNTGDIDEHHYGPQLMFLIEKNVVGRDAAAEARMAGHEEVASWFEEVINRVDPDGKRNGDLEGIAKRVQDLWYS